jgi:hypothetical protein
MVGEEIKEPIEEPEEIKELIREKRKSRHELILLLNLGIKPTILISLGYSKKTVYLYNQYLEEAKINLTKKLFPQFYKESLG